jgi:hypothetical protein
VVIVEALCVAHICNLVLDFLYLVWVKDIMIKDFSIRAEVVNPTAIDADCDKRFVWVEGKGCSP